MMDPDYMRRGKEDGNHKDRLHRDDEAESGGVNTVMNDAPTQFLAEKIKARKKSTGARRSDGACFILGPEWMGRKQPTLATSLASLVVSASSVSGPRAHLSSTLYSAALSRSGGYNFGPTALLHAAKGSTIGGVFPASLLLYRCQEECYPEREVFHRKAGS
jgi:hypothetical protein